MSFLFYFVLNISKIDSIPKQHLNEWIANQKSLLNKMHLKRENPNQRSFHENVKTMCTKRKFQRHASDEDDILYIWLKEKTLKIMQKKKQIKEKLFKLSYVYRLYWIENSSQSWNEAK